MTEASGTQGRKPTPPDAGKAPRRRRLPDLGPLPWIGPALLLIFGVVLWPAFEMIRTSSQDISISGLTVGFAGFDNYRKLFSNPELPGVLIRTITWVFVVVTTTKLCVLFLKFHLITLLKSRLQ